MTMKTLAAYSSGRGCSQLSLEILEARYALDAGMAGVVVAEGLPSAEEATPILAAGELEQTFATNRSAESGESAAPSKTAPILQIETRLRDAEGNLIKSLKAGEAFTIEIYGRDISEVGAGIFSLYLDAKFDEQMATVAGEINISPDFPAGKWIKVGDGRFGVGGTSNKLSPTGPGVKRLAQIPMTAQQDGPFEMQLRLAENQILLPATVYSEARALLPDEIIYQGETLTLVPQQAVSEAPPTERPAIRHDRDHWMSASWVSPVAEDRPSFEVIDDLVLVTAAQPLGSEGGLVSQRFAIREGGEALAFFPMPDQLQASIPVTAGHASPTTVDQLFEVTDEEEDAPSLYA
ncbi:MAG: hypothetical protein AAGF97_04340 [Planctomycetota bacterium]